MKNTRSISVTRWCLATLFISLLYTVLTYYQSPDSTLTIKELFFMQGLPWGMIMLIVVYAFNRSAEGL